ncbi:MAG TPA: peptidoglycan editing factor PgeF [Tepidisphaeraceae bacterium]|jgi:hypothetical protein|nr:peptidoglycan editing factor PgeF [Tepidisphaeraceae bacterium]
MFQRRQSDGVVYYSSTLLHSVGAPHAFSTRIGGVSPAPFDSLNLGNPNGCESQDDYDRIWENYRLLHRAAGCHDRQRPCRVHQVHGNAVAVVRGGQEFDTRVKADALVTDDPSRTLSVRVADCVPILIADGDGRHVAAVHAGWRGVVGGAVTAAMKFLSAAAPGGRFVAAIGPCIGVDAFEVGEEVLAAFVRAFGEQSRAICRPGEPGKGFVDLKEAVRRQLLAAGVDADRIDVSDRCTFRDADEFYSHRRENGVTGRMAAVIRCRATSA